MLGARVRRAGATSSGRARYLKRLAMGGPGGERVAGELGRGGVMADDVVHDDQTPAKRSGVEILKERSRQLRGTIPETLASDVSHFSHDEYQLLKFHGVYQQDDRDARAAARQSGAEKSWMMMVRAKIPGGRLSADQYLRFDELATRYGNDTLRVTSRQCFQLHYVGKGDLQPTIQGINESLITTLGACG